MSHNIHWANIFTSVGTVGAVAVSLGFGVGTYRSNHRRIKRSQLNQARTVVVSVEPPPTRKINSDGSLRVHNTGNFAIYDLHVTCLVEDHEWWRQDRRVAGCSLARRLHEHAHGASAAGRPAAGEWGTGGDRPGLERQDDPRSHAGARFLPCALRRPGTAAGPELHARRGRLRGVPGQPQVDGVLRAATPAVLGRRRASPTRSSAGSWPPTASRHPI